MTIVSENTRLDCYHCGDEIGKEPVLFDDKNFCCTGCRSVYEILLDEDLCDYYALQDKAGIKGKKASLAYDFLDQVEVKKALHDFYDQDLARVRLSIPNIHCSSCVWLLEKLPQLLSGVLELRVNFIRKEVSIIYNPSAISLREVVENLDRLGYVPDISFNDLGESKPSKALNRKLLYRIGIAGFCFGNIMLMSFPEYLAGDSGFQESFGQYFGVINLVLSLPVILYSGWGYLRSAVTSLRAQTLNLDVPIAIGMLTLFLRSTYEILFLGEAGYMDSLAGFVFFLLIGEWFKSKTYKALSFERDYRSYFPAAVNRLVDGEEEQVPLGQVEKGDRIRIRSQELIPADGLIIKGTGSIDYSFVTGETDSVSKEQGENVYAGGRQVAGTLDMEVTKPISESYLAGLWQEKAFKAKESKWSSMIDRIANVFTIVLITLAVFAGVTWYFIDPTKIPHVVTSVLIVACPCALALTLPFTYGYVMRILGKNGVYLRESRVVEELMNVDAIVFDKTGTLTSPSARELTYDGAHLTQEETTGVRSLADQSIHPLSRALAAHLHTNELNMVESFSEVPGRGVSGVVDGHEIRLGKFVEPKQDSEGSAVQVLIDGHYKGTFKVFGTFRNGIKELLKRLRKRHLELHLLSGDNASESSRFLPYFESLSLMHFNQSPLDKLNYIKQLQASGKRVLMVGDGLNDAGALKQSNVGVSVTDQTHAFAPACDIILKAEQLSQFDKVLALAQKASFIVRISFIFSLLYNLIGLTFALQGLLSPVIAAILMPLSSITVVAFISAWAGSVRHHFAPHK